MNRILIVDDEPDIRETLGMLLEMEGYAVETASTGQEAIKKMSTIAPDLVLSDVMMPVMNGIEILKRIKAHPQHREIPVRSSYRAPATSAPRSWPGAMRSSKNRSISMS